MRDPRPGDVVKLRGGGPEMTVSEVVGGSVTCVWFQQLPGSWGDVKTRTFHFESIELVRR